MARLWRDRLVLIAKPWWRSVKLSLRLRAILLSMESRLSTVAQGAAVSGAGSAVPDVGDACSSYIARSAHRSLPVVSATISHTSACKSTTRAWTDS